MVRANYGIGEEAEGKLISFEQIRHHLEGHYRPLPLSYIPLNPDNPADNSADAAN